MSSLSPEDYETLFRESPIGIAIVGLDGSWVEVNDAICELLEYTRAELLTRTFQDVTHPEDVKPDVEMVNTLIRGESDSYQMHKRYITKTGNVRWVTLSVHIQRDQITKDPQHFVSQIVPFIPASRATIKKANGAAESLKLQMGEVKKNAALGSFVKDNWKTMATIIGVVISGAVTVGVAWRSIEMKSTANEAKIEQMNKTLEVIKKAVIDKK